MTKKIFSFIITLLFLFYIRLNVNADVSEYDYKCKFNDKYDNICFYKMTDFSKDGKKYGDYSDEVANSILASQLPVELGYNSSITHLHWIGDFKNPDAENKHYFLDNINGIPQMELMQSDSSDGKPSNFNNPNYMYYNYISSDHIVNICPSKIFQYSFVDFGNNLGNKNYYYWYINENSFEKPKKNFYDHEYLYEYDLVHDCNINETSSEINECSLLIDEDLKKYINMAFNFIHISVPIILLCFIIYDLVMSLLDGSDDKMKKTKKRIIIRLIIAIAIFFVPTLVDFVLDLVNSIWATNFDTCL